MLYVTTVSNNIPVNSIRHTRLNYGFYSLQGGVEFPLLGLVFSPQRAYPALSCYNVNGYPAGRCWDDWRYGGFAGSLVENQGRIDPLAAYGRLAGFCLR
jgi:hypothetical protein